MHVCLQFILICISLLHYVDLPVLFFSPFTYFPGLCCNRFMLDTLSVQVDLLNKH